MIKVAINGFGRIGRLALREILTGTDFDIIAINGTSSPEDCAYLFKYDSTFRTFHPEMISYDENNLIINNSKYIKIFQEMDASNLPWKELDIDLVLECSGHYTKYDDALKHINAGAKKVLISAPGKGDMKTIVYGVNDGVVDGNEQIVSAASCTTNCLAPVLNVINKKFGIKEGMMSTIHAYTNDQNTLDGNHNKGITSRRGRGCFQNIIPTSTGAAGAIGKVIPELKGKWSFYLIPGTYNEETGKVDHTSTASGTGAVIMKQPEKLSEAKKQAKYNASWEFLKWWTGAETQAQFGREMEGILGSAARHATANVKAFQSLAWPQADLDKLMKQWDQVHEMPQVAGSYIIGREIENAYRKVINNNYNARETLYEYCGNINDEINRKRKEFDLPTIN